MPRPRSHLLACLLMVACIVPLAPPAVADHPQPINGHDTIRFDHRGGNTWWVEVAVEAYAVDAVYARTEGGTWQELTLRSWGTWAASFHIPPGERVQFQAMQAGGMSDVYRVTSCFFTHPEGVEQCASSDTQPFQASFHNAVGNAWWQQVDIDANRPVAAAHVAFYGVHGWTYHPLTQRDWGSWATSKHAPQGTTLRFVATDGTETTFSGCLRWTDAQPVACPPEYGPNPPSGYMTRFDHRAGNAWWVEVAVGPVGPDRVVARADGGPWVDLTLRDWGHWAASFRVEPGQGVEFRALVDGTWWQGCRFTHPEGLGPDGEQVCENTGPA